MSTNQTRAGRDASANGSLLETSGAFPAEGTPEPGRARLLPSSAMEVSLG